MELTIYEKKAIQEYISAISQHRSPKDVIRDCRNSIIRLFQNICVHEYNLSTESHEFKNPRQYVVETRSFFAQMNPSTRKLKFHSQLHSTVFKQVNNILGERIKEEYGIEDEADNMSNHLTEELANQCKTSLKIILMWYLNNHKKISLNSITNLNFSEKKPIEHLFEIKNINQEGPIKEREYHYVILLVDSSQSMLWPYLNDQSNANNENSSDYKNAVVQVQNAMQFAHEKALNALRGSRICKDRYLKIFQYTFNQKGIVLNAPEELNPFGIDKVVQIDHSNYTPEGMTALYEVLEEALKVVYEKYLKGPIEKEKRVDKVIIGIISDGEDTIIGNASRFQNPQLYELKKAEKVANINNAMKKLRGNGDLSKCFLISSVLIGLTGTDFSETKLKEIKKELNFDEYVSIDKADEQSIRQSFKLFSTNAINV